MIPNGTEERLCYAPVMEQQATAAIAEPVLEEGSLLTRKQAARLLNISPWSLDRLRQRGRLPAISLGPSIVRYLREDLEAFIRQLRQGPPPRNLS